VQVGKKMALKIGQPGYNLWVPAGIKERQDLINQQMGLVDLFLGGGFLLFQTFGGLIHFKIYPT